MNKQLLLNYNKTVSDLEILKSEIDILKLQEELFDESAETLKATCYEEGMPLHFGNEFNSKTENIATRREGLLLNIKKMELKYKELERDKIIVDAKLKLLDNHERFLIQKKYIENIKFAREIIKMFEIEIGIYINKNTLSNKLSIAMEKLMR